jgi:hypothetical protein
LAVLLINHTAIFKKLEMRKIRSGEEIGGGHLQDTGEKEH